MVRLTQYDRHPLNFNRDTMLQWLVDSNWIENYIRKQMRDTPNYDYVEDYIQEIWIQIIEKADKLVDIFQNKGKGHFTNYLKMIMNNNIHSSTSPAYVHLRKRKEKNEVYLNDAAWDIIDNTYDYETGEPYKEILPSVENPFDKYYTEL